MSIRDKMTGKSDRYDEWSHSVYGFIESFEKHFHVKIDRFSKSGKSSYFIETFGLDEDDIMVWVKNTPHTITGCSQRASGRVYFTLNIGE